MLGKLLGIKCGRGNDELKARALGKKVVQVAQQKIDIQTTLVGLIDDDQVVGLKPRIGLGFGKQHAVGQKLNGHAGPRLVIKPDLVAHPCASHATTLRGDLLRDAASHRYRSKPAGLGVANRLALGTKAAGHGDLGQLSGLARTGLAAQDKYLVGQKRLRNFLPARRNRKRLGELQAQG